VGVVVDLLPGGNGVTIAHVGCRYHEEVISWWMLVEGEEWVEWTCCGSRSG
jgi:hypothetical protein